MIQDVPEPAVANFVQKSFEIISNEENESIVSWLSSGKEFIIKDTELFQSIILPRYFRHRNINSFIRQLNMYGFHKSRKDPTKNIFSHPNFVQGRAELLMNVRRKIKQEKAVDENAHVEPTIIKAKEQEVISQKIVVQQPKQPKIPLLLSRQSLRSRQHLQFTFSNRQKQLQRTAIKPCPLSSLCSMDNIDQFPTQNHHKPSVDWQFRSLIQKSQILELNNPDLYNIKFQNLTSLNHIDEIQFDFICEQSSYPHNSVVDDIEQQRKRLNNRMAGFNILQTINFMSQLNL